MVSFMCANKITINCNKLHTTQDLLNHPDLRMARGRLRGEGGGLPELHTESGAGAG